MKKKPNLYSFIFILILAMTSLACGLGGNNPEPEATTAAEEPAATEAIEPTDEPEPALDLTTYEDNERGITFDYPSEWVVEAESTSVVVGTEAGVLEGDDLTDGAGLSFIAGDTEIDDGLTPAGALEQFSDFFLREEDDTELVEPATTTTINGQEAATMVITTPTDDGDIGTVMLGLIYGDTQRIVYLAAFRDSQADQYRPLLTDIINSVTVSDFTLDLGFDEPEPETEPEPEPTVESSVEPTAEPEPIVTEADPISQWASSAIASSQYGDDAWSANQMVGEPDTDGCGDYTTAWASSSSTGVDWVEVYYDVPVYITEIHVVQTLAPDQVVGVELIGTDGAVTSVFTQAPIEEECPYTLILDVTDADFPVYGVRLSIDQSILGLGWNEIDAVQIVGVPVDGDVSVISPPAPPVVEIEVPEGFDWRVGGESGIFEGEYSALGGMDIDANGLLYVADNIHGVHVFDLNGEKVNVIDHDDFNNPADVKIGPNGNIYVASWGSDSIFVFSPDGTFITEFGEEGTGDGQFGTFAPQSIAIGLDGLVYALDDNEDVSGEDYERVQVFDADGNFLYWFPVEDDFFAATAMDVGPNGSLYVLGFIGGYIIEYDAVGNVLNEIGEEVLGFTGPQGLAIDNGGFFYVSTWDESPFYLLSPTGELLSNWGYEVDEYDEAVAWGEGGFYQAGGIAVLGNGTFVAISDWSGDYSFVTGFIPQ